MVLLSIIVLTPTKVYTLMIAAIVAFLAKTIFSKSVVGAITQTASDWFNRRQQMNELRQSFEIRKEEAKYEAEIEHLRTQQEVYGDADVAAVKSWKSSYIDEVLVLTVVAMVIAPFIPGLNPYIQDGIKILQEYPFWLQILVGGTFMSILGMRYLFMAPLEKIFKK